MKTIGIEVRSSQFRRDKQFFAFLLSFALLIATLPLNLSAQDAPPPQDTQAPAQGGQAPPYAQQTPEQLQRLVAPIALYPDLKGDDLAKAIDQQPWDPSVKALAAFPSVLGNMDKNLSWTSSLGDAYYNQP